MSDQASGSRFNTLAIHAGRRHARAEQHTANDLVDDLHLGEADAASLARRLLDTSASGQRPSGSAQAVLEERIAALDGGSAALAIASGPMARLVALQTLMQPGDEVVVARALSRGKRAAFAQSFKSFGWLVKAVDPEQPESFVEALSDKTKAILVESISAYGAITDLETIARVAQRARVPLVVDNSLATPILVRPFEHGADVVIYSEPKLLCGPTCGLGLIVDGGSFEWINDVRYPALAGPVEHGSGLVVAETFGNFAFAMACRLASRRDYGGAALPRTAASALFGIETLPLRMHRHCDNAQAVARHLERHPAVSRVRCAGVVVGFQLVGGRQAEDQLLDRLRLVVIDREVNGGSIGDTCSTIIRDDQPGALRLSAGLEDEADIIADLDQAMAD